MANGLVFASLTVTKGVLVPGGQITVNGSFLLNADASLAIDIAGNTPGTEHDQVIVNGTVTINGAVLTGSTTTAPTATITIIANDASDAIVGSRFSGAPNNGDIVTIGGQNYVISYIGGTGNDVTLFPTVLLGPARPAMLTPTATLTPSTPSASPTVMILSLIHI